MTAPRPHDFDRSRRDSRISGLEQDVARLERQASELEHKIWRARLDIDGYKNDFMLLVFALANVAVIAAAILTRR